jgi:hypothetical protein
VRYKAASGITFQFSGAHQLLNPAKYALDKVDVPLREFDLLGLRSF